MGYDAVASFHVTEDDDNFYLFSANYYPDYWPDVIAKDFSNVVASNYFNSSDFTENQVTLLTKYADLYYFYSRYIYNSSLDDWDSFAVTDSKKYDDGFIVTGVDYDNEVSYLYYEEDSTLIWKKTFNNKYIENVISYDGNFIITCGDYNDGEVANYKLVVLDTAGNIIENDDLLKNYYSGDDYYADYMTNTLDGFVVSYKPENSEGNTRITHFSKYYHITSETVGNGVITIQSIASYNERVKLVIEPKDGYYLASVKVYDSKDNEIKLDDNYEFIMPEGDVKIQAKFIKNPVTSSFSVILLGIIIISIMAFSIVNIKRLKNNKIINEN